MVCLIVFSGVVALHTSGGPIWKTTFPLLRMFTRQSLHLPRLLWQTLLNPKVAYLILLNALTTVKSEPWMGGLSPIPKLINAAESIRQSCFGGYDRRWSNFARGVASSHDSYFYCIFFGRSLHCFFPSFGMTPDWLTYIELSERRRNAPSLSSHVFAGVSSHLHCRMSLGKSTRKVARAEHSWWCLRQMKLIAINCIISLPIAPFSLMSGSRYIVSVTQ